MLVKSRFVKTVCFFCEEKEMKLLKQVVLLLAIMLAMAVEVWEQERELIFGAATMRGCV